MAKRKLPPKPQIEYKCEDCAHGKWIEKHENKDYKGDWICLRCPYSETARIRDWKACAHFKKK